MLFLNVCNSHNDRGISIYSESTYNRIPIIPTTHTYIREFIQKENGCFENGIA